MAATANGSVTVEWNYAITASLNMYTQTTASHTSAAPAANDIFVQANGGAGQCNGSAGSTKDSYGQGSGYVNFGSVVADNADYTDCLEINAIDLYYVTNDSNGAVFQVSESGAPTDYDTASHGSLLCIAGDGFTVGATAASPAWTTSARAAATTEASTVACAANYQAITSTAATFFTANSAAFTGADLNQDIQLQLGPQAQSGQQTVVVAYTMTTN